MFLQHMVWDIELSAFDRVLRFFSLQVIQQDYLNMIFIYRQDVNEEDFGQHKAPMLPAIKVSGIKYFGELIR